MMKLLNLYNVQMFQDSAALEAAACSAQIESFSNIFFSFFCKNTDFWNIFCAGLDAVLLEGLLLVTLVSFYICYDA